MRPAFICSQKSIELRGKRIPDAEDRQKLIPDFDQEAFSKASVVCIGAGGIISNIAPTLVRKGVGKITLLDDDIVEPSNLNRQRFYARDIGKNKAVALARNLRAECIAETVIRGVPLRLQEAIACSVDLQADIAICGVDNNPARVVASRYLRSLRMPVVFSAVSRDATHGYVFVQEPSGPCIACLFPDIADEDHFPCPGTPAIADILQALGALAVYATDTLLMKRIRGWNYRRLHLTSGSFDGCRQVTATPSCRLCGLTKQSLTE